MALSNVRIYRKFNEHNNKRFQRKAHVHQYKVQRNSKFLNGSHYRMAGDLEMCDTLGIQLLGDEFNLFTQIVQKIIVANEEYAGARKITDKKELNIKTWIWRHKIDKHSINLLRLRSSSTALICIPSILNEYLLFDKAETTLWFADKSRVSTRVSRWVLTADSDFDEQGLPTQLGAGKFTAKFGFAPVVLTETKESILWQWQRMYSICLQLRQCVWDEQKSYFYKICQWNSFFKTIIRISVMCTSGMKASVTFDK